MPSSVTFYVNTSRDAVADKMNNGIYDVAYLNNLNYSRITDKSSFNTQSVENTVYSFILNQSDKYLGNKNIRLALAYSADLSLAGTISDDIKPAVSFVPRIARSAQRNIHRRMRRAPYIPLIRQRQSSILSRACLK